MFARIWPGVESGSLLEVLLPEPLPFRSVLLKMEKRIPTSAKTPTTMAMMIMIFLAVNLFWSARDMASSASTRARSAASSASSLDMTTVGGAEPWLGVGLGFGPEVESGGVGVGGVLSMWYIIY